MTGIVFLLLGMVGVSAQGNAFTSTQHMNSKATVMLLDGKTTLRLEAPNAAPRLIPLSGDWKQVTMMRFSQDASRLAIIGRGAASQAAIVDVASGSTLVTFPVSAAVVSPDARALIVERAGNVQPGPSRFSLIPLAGPEGLLRSSSDSLDIHTDGRAAARLSDFVWLDPEVVAFVELTGSEARVVALQVDPSGKIQKRAEKAIPAQVFVDTAFLKDRAAAARAFSGVEITRIPSSGLTLRVNLAPGASVKTRATELQMWQ